MSRVFDSQYDQELIYLVYPEKTKSSFAAASGRRKGIFVPIVDKMFPIAQRNLNGKHNVNPRDSHMNSYGGSANQRQGITAVTVNDKATTTAIATETTTPFRGADIVGKSGI